MACGRAPVYREVGPQPGWCLLSQTSIDQCPTGWVEDGYVKISRSEAQRRGSRVNGDGGGYCAQDFFEALGADTSRFRKRCRKVRWDANTFQIPCCLGRTSNQNANCHPDWCFESKACDTVVSNYCKTPQGMKDPKCGCLLPQSEYENTLLYGPPECVDKRCASNPQAYQTERQRNRVCNITNCVIGGDVGISGENNLDTEIIAQQCGPRFQDLRQGETSPTEKSSTSFFDSIKNNPVVYGFGAGLVLLGGLVGGGYYIYSQRKKE